MASHKNYKLYRTNPVLGGNMKMDIILRPSGEIRNNNVIVAKVVGFQLSPISDLVSHTNIQNENLLVRPHEMNIKRFFDSHKEYFYKPVIDATLASDWHYAIPDNISDTKSAFIKTWDDTYWCGTKRISSHNKYNATFEVFCPMWLESCSGLKFQFDINPINSASGSKSIVLELEYPKHKPQKEHTFQESFSKYIFDYLSHAGITNFEDPDAGSDKCVNIDLTNMKTIVYGMDVNEARFTAREDSNLVNNLTFRERFLVEANSNILQLFPTHHLICPNILNFNFVLDDSLLPGDDVVATKSAFNRSYITSATCWTRKHRVHNYKDAAGLSKTKDVTRWIEAREADFATNHEYVPRINTKRSPQKTDKNLNLNVLDHLRDNEVVNIIHYNKINQYVPLWCYTGNPDSIFNIYNGFGSYYYMGNNVETPKDGSIDKVTDRGNIVENNHVNGTTNADVNDETNNIELSNWTGYVGRITAIGAEKDDEYSIHTVITSTSDINTSRKFIDDIPLMHDATGNVGSIQFNFSSDKYDKMYVGICTTEPLTDQGSTGLTNQKYINDSWSQINILYGRFDQARGQGYINSLPSNLRFNASSYNGSNKLAEFYADEDIKYQVFRNADATNKYHTSFGSPNGPTQSRDWNKVKDSRNYSLSCIFWEAEIKKDADEIERGDVVKGDTNKCLMVLFFSPSYIPSVEQTQERGFTYLGGALRVQNIIEATKAYLKMYGEDYMAKNDPVLFGYLEELVTNGIKNIESNKLISISKTIQTKTDNILSTESTELVPYKRDEVNDYVFRPQGNIKPAIYPPAYLVSEDHRSVSYYNRYGLNFFWHKKIFKNKELGEMPNFNLYAYKNITPRYPSLLFDSVVRDKQILGYRENNPIYFERYGILNYEYPCPILKGRRYDNSDPREIITVDDKKVWDPTLGQFKMTRVSKTRDDHPGRYTDWPEYKWFNESKIRIFPEHFPLDGAEPFHILVQENDKDYIEAVVWDLFITKAEISLANGVDNMTEEEYKPYLIEYLKTIYKVEYDLVDSHKEWPKDLTDLKAQYTGANSLLFEYNIKIKLA